MDIFNRQWIEWSEPLNEIFGFAGMPFDDLTKPDSISRPGDKLWWLTNDNTKWDDRQNTYIKASVHLLSTFPGMISKRMRDDNSEGFRDVQMFHYLPKYPFLDTVVDLSHSNLDQILAARELTRS
jgi:hypothetical protein